MKAKRILGLILVVCCCMTCFVSVSAADEFDAKAVAQGAKLTVAVPEQAKVLDYNTNALTLQIENDLGVDLEFVTYPAADYASKLNLMVESGDKLPDIIFKPTNKCLSWAEDGAIIPLNKYYDDPNFSKNIRIASENLGFDVAKYMKNADGIIYGVPQYGASLGSIVAQKMWVYRPWLDAIGKDVPKTAEEFLAVCRLLAGQDLNGNGINDEMMISGCNSAGGQTWLNYLMTPFVYAHGKEYLKADNGTLSFAYTDEGWKEGLKYLKTFFDEGLLTTEILTQDADQYWAQVYSEVPSVFSFVYYHYANAQLNNKINYVAIPALEDENGNAMGYYMPSVPAADNPGAVISADCENPDAAFLVCDYLLNREVSISQRYGVQGVNWDYWADVKIDNKDDYEAAFPGYDISIYLYDNDNYWASTEAQNSSYLQSCPFIFDVAVPSGKAVLKEGTTEEEKLQAETDKIVNSAIVECFSYIPEEVVDYLPMTAEETARVNELKPMITTFVSQSRAEFITGLKDIDAEWDNYLNELAKMGVDELLSIYQTAYSRTK